MKTRPFTLFEMLIVMILVALFSGVGIKTIHKQRFRSSVEVIRSKVELAKDLALYQEKPIELTLTPHSITVSNKTIRLKGIDTISPSHLTFSKRPLSTTITIRSGSRIETIELNPPTKAVYPDV